MSKFLRVLPIPLLTLRQKPFAHLSPITLYFTFQRCTFSSSLSAVYSQSVAPLRIISASGFSTAASSSELIVSDQKKTSIPINDSPEWVSRTGLCGELSESDVGRRVKLCGWVALHRVHGGLTFINLRDHTGIVQIATIPDKFPDAHSMVNGLRLEYVIALEGTVRLRPGESINRKMKTGTIEVVAEYVQLLNSVRSKLPFLVTTADDVKDSVKEEIRLRYHS